MPRTQTASEQITEAVTAWPGVQAGPGSRGEFAFTIGRRQIGHLHGDHVLHLGFPKAVWHELYEAGQVESSLNVIASPIQSVRDIFDQMPTGTPDEWATIGRRLSAVPAALEGLRA